MHSVKVSKNGVKSIRIVSTERANRLKVETTEDSMNVELKVVSSCDTIKELASRFKEKTPIDAYQELSPKKESIILALSRPVLVQKGCCEACVVPAAVCKAIPVVAGLALPQDVTLKITKQ